MSPRDRTDRPRNRSRIALAALATLGIGAAVTTAAWTDQVWFQAPAEAATFNLQARASLSDEWGEYATEGESLIIPIDSSGFGNIVPGAGPLTTEVYVKNASSVDTSIALATVMSGTLFDAGSTVTVSATPDKTDLAAGEYATIQLTLEAGEIPAHYQGAEGTISLQVSASSAP